MPFRWQSIEIDHYMLSILSEMRPHPHITEVIVDPTGTWRVPDNRTSNSLKREIDSIAGQLVIFKFAYFLDYHSV